MFARKFLTLPKMFKYWNILKLNDLNCADFSWYIKVFYNFNSKSLKKCNIHDTIDLQLPFIYYTSTYYYKKLKITERIPETI